MNNLIAISPLEWRPIPGYEGLYSASSNGDVRIDVTRLPRKAGSLMSLRVQGDKGLVVGLSGADKKQRNHLVHTLIAATFLPLRPSASHVISHLDGNKSNNALTNIAWVHRAGDITQQRLPAVDSRGTRWSVIPAFPSYEVSDQGEIRHAFNGPHQSAGVLIATPVGVHRYNHVSLRSAVGKRTTKTVHKLVAQAFCPGEAEGLVVDHIDGNRRNNCAANLRWVTQSQNMEHAQYDHGTRGRLNMVDCARIIERYNAGENQAVIASDYKVSQNQISMILLGKSWKRAAKQTTVRRFERADMIVVADPGLEVWRTAVGPIGVDVSNHGRIRWADNREIIIPSLHKGYALKKLPTKEGLKMFKVHRLVATSFLPTPEAITSKLYVNHRNYCRDDNRVTNLEWVNAAQNMRHRFGYRYMKRQVDKGYDAKMAKAVDAWLA